VYSVFFKAKWQKKTHFSPMSNVAIFLQLRACSVISDDFHLAFCIRKGNPQYRSMRKAGERGGAELRWARS
jgi:hypothetical protein